MGADGANGTWTTDQTTAKPTSGLSSRINHLLVAGKQQRVILANRNLSITCLCASRFSLFFLCTVLLSLALRAKDFSGQCSQLLLPLGFIKPQGEG